MKEKATAVKDSDANSQVSAITFMYTSSSLNSRKKVKDGIQQMNENSSRLHKSRLAKLPDDQPERGKKDSAFSKKDSVAEAKSKKSEQMSRLSKLSKHRTSPRKEDGDAAQKVETQEEPEEIKEDPEEEQATGEEAGESQNSEQSEKDQDGEENSPEAERARRLMRADSDTEHR